MRGGHAITDPFAHLHPNQKVKNALFYRGELALMACENLTFTLKQT